MLDAQHAERLHFQRIKINSRSKYTKGSNFLTSKSIRLGSVSITRGEASLEIKIAKVLNKQKQIQNVVTKSVHFSRLSCKVR